MILNARSLSIKIVDDEDAKRFLELEHRSGALKGGIPRANIGLYTKEGELVGLAQFGSPRTSAMLEKYSFELLRLAFKREARVRGGASKLIRYFIEVYHPADFFTYQDTSGEATSVYEHAGMKLVSQAKKKQYLVAPGKTLDTGSRKQVLGMAYATRYGPDRILGTKLGEVMDPKTGKRKSNKRIFIEELGWHIEETTGDRVYEWVDPNRTYYTYKITASDSEKYYYGVSHVKKANATLEDCLNDGYYGSGGAGKQNKFSNWKKTHSKKLEKTVIELHLSSREAYAKEKALVGELWKNDLNCLNGTSGGKFGGISVANGRFSKTFCEIHGESTHSNGECLRCRSAKIITVELCEVHGETTFRAGKCSKCQSKIVTIKQCPIHGSVKHSGDTCRQCAVSARSQKKVCPVHGRTKHSGEKCYKCFVTRAVHRECPVHGGTKHLGGSCLKCLSANRRSLQTCEIHNETVFLDGKCAKCAAGETNSLKHCRVHGISAHIGDTCKTCVSQKAVRELECPIHGVAKHRGDKCYKCIQEKTTHSRYHKETPKPGCRFCIQRDFS